MVSKKVLLFSGLILMICCTCFAQTQVLYSFQKDDTLLRKNYYDQSLSKKALLLAGLSKENAKEYKSIYEQQFDEIGSLWHSTRPVTSPDANTYLQSVVQKIITANAVLKGTDARVVFSRDWWPNAVSMGDGTIAINAGLVIYLQSEAELVFIVCHELAHYYLQHSQKAIKKYVETITSESYQSDLRRLSKEQYGANKQLERLAKLTAFSSRKHSRDNETEADRQAFVFMQHTGYDCSAIKSCLNMMDKVDDSLLYKRPNLQQVFHFTEYPFKKKWIQKESVIFSEMKEDNESLSPREKDSLKTHPDCANRVVMLTDSLAKVLGKGKKFIVNEVFFNQLKNDFLLEISEECFRENKLTRNLYYNILLLQTGDHNAFASYSIARCLNQLYEYQKAHTFGLAVDPETRGYPENYNLLLRMINRLRLNEIAELAYAFCLQHMAEIKAWPDFEKELAKTKQHKQESSF